MASKHLYPLGELDDPGVVARITTATGSWAGMYAIPADTYILSPGNYDSWGGLEPGAAFSGTSSRRKVVRAEGDTAPWLRSAGDQVRIRGFVLGAATAVHHVLLHNLTVSGDAEYYEDTIRLEGSDYNVVNQCYFHTRPSAYGVRFLLFAEHNRVQRCVGLGPGGATDGAFVQVKVPTAAQGSGPSHGNGMVDCEVIDWNDGGAISQSEDENSDTCNGTVFDGNRVYLTSASHTQGGTKATCENAFDVKGGSSDPNDPVRITNNVFHGFRYSDAGTADGSGIVVHQYAKNVLVEGNVGFDMPCFLRESVWPDPLPQVSRELTVKNNVAYGIHQYAAEDRGVVYQIRLPETCVGNVWSNAVTMSDTTMVTGSLTMHGNTSVGVPLGQGAAPWAAGLGNVERDTADMVPLAVTIKSLTAPETILLPHAVYRPPLGGLGWAMRRSHSGRSRRR